MRLMYCRFISGKRLLSLRLALTGVPDQTQMARPMAGLTEAAGLAREWLRPAMQPARSGSD